MRAEIIFTGTELLLGHTLNTNAPYLQQVLAFLGIDLYYQVTAGDNRERLARAITQARERADLIIIGGGLGPTEDDVSREALADSLGISLQMSEEALQVVRRFFDERGLPMSENNLKQALVPEGGIVLDNPIGTAPGIILERAGKTYLLLPGPPSEFRLMVDRQVTPYLLQKLGAQRKLIQSRVLKLCGIGESTVDQQLGELLRGANPTVAPTAKYAEVHLRITAKADSPDEARRMNAAMEEKIRRRLGKYIFGADEETLADAAGRVFLEGGLTLATVETFTGGLLAHRLTGAPGAGSFFKFGYVLGENRRNWPVAPSAGSGKETAEQLAAWGRSAAGADVCVAITKQAEDGKQEKSRPGATVYIATRLDERAGGQSRSGEFYIWGGSPDVQERAVQVALALLWRMKDAK
ncbi:MAG: CinA family nicotinamide mononucleotide deamidase-related protein [Bacillota bacterium]